MYNNIHVSITYHCTCVIKAPFAHVWIGRRFLCWAVRKCCFVRGRGRGGAVFYTHGDICEPIHIQNAHRTYHCSCVIQTPFAHVRIGRQAAPVRRRALHPLRPLAARVEVASLRGKSGVGFLKLCFNAVWTG